MNYCENIATYYLSTWRMCQLQIGVHIGGFLSFLSLLYTNDNSFILGKIG